jgi:DNA-directed RNA polymerase specialized sigma24 family protein
MSKVLPVATAGDGWRTQAGEARPSAALERAVATEEDATQRFVRLYRELFPPLHGYIRFRVGDLHAAEDLTAQVFERALARLASVREPERVRAWLFTIARNAIVDYRRRRRSAAETGCHSSSGSPSPPRRPRARRARRPMRT